MSDRLDTGMNRLVLLLAENQQPLLRICLEIWFVWKRNLNRLSKEPINVADTRVTCAQVVLDGDHGDTDAP